MKNVTKYSGITGYYFDLLLKEVIKIGHLDRDNIVILDFGCGFQKLKNHLPHLNILGFDKIKSLSDIIDWREIDFDVFVANQVFYLMNEKEFRKYINH